MKNKKNTDENNDLSFSHIQSKFKSEIEYKVSEAS